MVCQLLGSRQKNISRWSSIHWLLITFFTSYATLYATAEQKHTETSGRHFSFITSQPKEIYEQFLPQSHLRTEHLQILLLNVEDYLLYTDSHLLYTFHILNYTSTHTVYINSQKKNLYIRHNSRTTNKCVILPWAISQVLIFMCQITN